MSIRKNKTQMTKRKAEASEYICEYYGIERAIHFII